MLDWDNGEISTTKFISIKLLCLYLVQTMLHQIKAQLFKSDLDLYQQRKVLQKIGEFEVVSKLLHDFPVLFKAY